jgi:hypothetical protein
MRPQKLTLPKRCDCGRLAYRLKHGEPVCKRCDHMEHINHTHHTSNIGDRHLVSLNMTYKLPQFVERMVGV